MKHRPVLLGFAAIMVLASACQGAPRAVRTGAPPAVGTSAPPAVGTSAPPSSRHASVISRVEWLRGTGISNCAPAAMVRVTGKVMGAGDCAGLFLIPPEKVTVHVGQEIDVHVFGDGTLFTLPRSSDSAVLRRFATSPDGETGAYRAVHAGHAVLISHAWCVGPKIKGEITGSCPVLDVTVLPTGSY